MGKSSNLKDGSGEIARHAASAPASDGGSEQRRRTEDSGRTGSDGRPSPETAGARQDQTGGSSTVTAGRALFRAVKSDLAALGGRLARSQREARAWWRRKADPRGKRAATRGGGKLRRSGVIIVFFIQGMVMMSLVAAIVIAGGILWALYGASADRETRRQSLLLEASDGRPLGRAGPFADAAARNDFPDLLIKAVLSIEDRRFYQHAGIDPLAILRAATVNLDSGEIAQGGSTITQQLVRLRGLVGREQSMNRKLREAFAALWLDFRMEKDAILTEYLNRVYLGSGAYGVSAAARVYFGKRLSELSLAEAAMIAGLIQAPSVYNPLRNPEAARQRAAQVLDAMVATGAVDDRTALDAKAAPAVAKTAAAFAPANSWFGDWIASHEYPKVAGNEARAVRVRTTLVPELQQAAERIIADVLKAPRRGGPSQAALVAMRPDGAVVAMVGGRDYDESQFNRAADAQRQPGSAFKLFVYHAALRNGLSPGDVVDASPIRIKRWEPQNFGGRQYGRMTMEQAFAQSVNTAAVRLATDVGIGKVIAAARDLGIDAPLPTVPSLALGTAELTLVDLAGAFASVRAGRRVDPFGITAFGPENEGLRNFSAPTGAALAFREELVTLLRGVVTSGTGRSADTGGFVAGKTGTSQDHRDAWFVGFNETLVVGVWVGNDDRSPMRGVTGGSLPAQIWSRFVKAAGADAEKGGPRVDAVLPAPVLALEENSLRERQGDANPAACNVEICAMAYGGFRASDCTYQPRRGERRVCAIPPHPAGAPAEARAQLARDPSCNIDVCSRRYRSFDPTDCSYQPYGDISRRFCDAE